MQPPKPELPESTFSDFHYTRKDHSRHANSTKPKSSSGKGRRWSYVLQDTPQLIRDYLNDINKGYVARVGAVSAVAVLSLWSVYHFILTPRQEKKPLARRWWLFSPAVPITLTDRTREEGSSMYVCRFALPHSYDCAGYDPVSSVRVSSGGLGGMSTVSRWYTPISHPDERGYIEFAIKDCDPGRMSTRLRQLQRGDVVYLGRWMREFDYAGYRRRMAAAGVACPELGVICSTSGASIALQLMEVIRRERDPPKLRVLYCYYTPKSIPFRREYFEPACSKSKGHVRVAYNVSSSARVPASEAEGIRYGENFFVGNLDPSTLEKTIPPPVAVYRPPGAPAESPGVAYRPQVLVCGPKSMQAYLCGHVSMYGNVTYWQGTPLQYSGFMADMGYTRNQVYKFGLSKHFLAVQ